MTYLDQFFKGGISGGLSILSGGIAVPARTKLNTTSPITATDNAGLGATDISMPASSATTAGYMQASQAKKLTGTHVDVVADYGAIANGSADDTVALQNAVSAVVAAGGGTVWIPASSQLKITDTISIGDGATPTTGVVLACARKSAFGATIIWAGGAGKPMLSIRNSHLGTMRNITINGNNAADYGLQFRHVSGDARVTQGWKFQECTFLGCKIYNVIEGELERAYTVDAATNTFTVTGHGYAANDLVSFISRGGSAPGGISVGTLYYVISAGLTANAFKVSTSLGGSAVDVTSQQVGDLNFVGKLSGGDASTCSFDNCRFGHAGTANNTTKTLAHYRQRSVNTLETGFHTCWFEGNNYYGFSVTADASANTFTATAHGMSNGDEVDFTAASLPGGVSAAPTSYYVVNKTADTFQIALTPGGSPVDITTTGTAVKAYQRLFPRVGIMIQGGTVACFGCSGGSLEYDIAMDGLFGTSLQGLHVYGWESQSKNFLDANTQGTGGGTAQHAIHLAGVYHADIIGDGVYSVYWNHAGFSPLTIHGSKFDRDVQLPNGSAAPVFVDGLRFLDVPVPATGAAPGFKNHTELVTGAYADATFSGFAGASVTTPLLKSASGDVTVKAGSGDVVFNDGAAELCRLIYYLSSALRLSGGSLPVDIHSAGSWVGLSSASFIQLGPATGNDIIYFGASPTCTWTIPSGGATTAFWESNTTSVQFKINADTTTASRVGSPMKFTGHDCTASGGIGGDIEFFAGAGGSGGGHAGAVKIGSGATERIRANSTGLGFFAATPVAKPSVTGALSTVADAPAKAVLTSIISALVNLGLASDGTT